MRFRVLTAALAAVTFAACDGQWPVTQPSNNSLQGPQFGATASNAASYVIDFVGNDLPADLERQVTAAGGTVTSRIRQVGVAVATSSDPAFAAKAQKIKGVFNVTEDIQVQWIPSERVVDAGEAVDIPPPEGTAFGDAETFRRVQWAPDAISAPAAWDLGAFGAGARVAIIDGAVYNRHIDIAPNLDTLRSRSFVPNPADSGRTFLPYNFDQARDTLGVCRLNDTFWHGTHVAGIVAAPGGPAAPNLNRGTVGIAPRATLIGVKALHCGSGAFSWIINAIVYAATPIAEGGAGADIINMSLGAQFARQGSGAAQLARALGKATTYAHQRGATVIAALGNNATDLDHTANTVFLPAMSPHVIAVSATAPLGFALGDTNYNRPTSYTNFGQSAVDFAAPGGDFDLPGNALCAIPRNPPGTGNVVTACWVFDMVIAPCRGSGSATGSYCFAAGTSMAAPAVSGVAALIIGRYGRMSPAHVEARLRASADDLGKPGNDDFYGGGRVNALRAIQ